MDSFWVIIPVRYAATRLPGKPLLDIAGRPMIQHVWNAACASKAHQVVIAADDERILAAAHGFGAHALATSSAHRSGMDRISEVVSRLRIPDEAVVVNVQGDEPLLPAQLINQVAALLQSETDADMATLCCKAVAAESATPDRVKVIVGAHRRALYFSRAEIPWGDPALMLRHIGIYAYRAGYLGKLSKLPAPRLEQAERLEQLRALYYGGHIAIEEAVTAPPHGVDTQEDLDAVRRAFSAIDK